MAACVDEEGLRDSEAQQMLRSLTQPRETPGARPEHDGARRAVKPASRARRLRTRGEERRRGREEERERGGVGGKERCGAATRDVGAGGERGITEEADADEVGALLVYGICRGYSNST